MKIYVVNAFLGFLIFFFFSFFLCAFFSIFSVNYRRCSTMHSHGIVRMSYSPDSSILFRSRKSLQRYFRYS